MDISKKLLEDIAKVRTIGIIKDPNSIEERFREEAIEEAKRQRSEAEWQAKRDHHYSKADDAHSRANMVLDRANKLKRADFTDAAIPVVDRLEHKAKRHGQAASAAHTGYVRAKWGPTIKESYGGYDGKFLYGGHFYNTKTFKDEGEAGEWLSYNQDHTIIGRSEDGTIHCAHRKASPTPQSGVGVVPTTESMNEETDLVTDLIMFVEHYPALHSLNNNLEARNLSRDIPIFSVHVKALIENARDDDTWMAFGYEVAKEYERQFGKKFP